MKDGYYANYESDNQFSINITATDGSGAATSLSAQINVTDVYEGGGGGFTYLLYGDEEFYSNFEAGQLDADDSLYDTSSNGMGKVGLYEKAKGELTLANKAFATLEDVDLFQIVDSIYSTTLSAGSYNVQVRNTIWDFGNNEFGSVKSFKIVNEFGLNQAALAYNHGDYFNDTLNFTADGMSSYFVELTGDMFDDAQYEITLDIV